MYVFSTQLIIPARVLELWLFVLFYIAGNCFSETYRLKWTITPASISIKCAFGLYWRFIYQLNLITNLYLEFVIKMCSLILIFIYLHYNLLYIYIMQCLIHYYYTKTMLKILVEIDRIRTQPSRNIDPDSTSRNPYPISWKIRSGSDPETFWIQVENPSTLVFLPQ